MSNVRINPFTLEKLQNIENFGFHERILLETKHLLLETDKTMVEAYKTAVGEFDKSLKQTRSLASTPNVVATAEAAEDAWYALNLQVEASFNHPKEQNRIVAKAAHDIMRKYGDIRHRGYNEVFGDMKNLLDDLLLISKENQQLIYIYDFVVELQSSYDAFMNAQATRIEEKSEREIGLTRTKRKEVDRAYRVMVERINALIIVNDIEPYNTFVANVNAITDELSAVLLARKTRSKSEK